MQDRARTHELRRLSQAEADAICARHERLWKARPGGARAVFAWCDLSGLSFKGRNLADADFSASVMHGTDLSGCKLDNANFFGADMQEADLSEASLRRTDLRGACLKGADLSGADLTDAVLVGVKSELWRTDGAQMQGVLTDDKSSQPAVAPLDAAERMGAHSRWCETAGADGRPSIFDGLDLRGLKSVRGFNLTALSAKKAVFYGLDMEGVQLQGAHLEGADLRACRLKGADLRGARLAGARLNGADLREAHLGPLLIGEDRLLPADLTGAVLRGADLSGADLKHARLMQADLRRANLLGAATRLADFTLARLEGAKGADAVCREAWG